MSKVQSIKKMTKNETILFDDYKDKFGKEPNAKTMLMVITPCAKRMESGEKFEWNETGNWIGLKKVNISASGEL